MSRPTPDRRRIGELLRNPNAARQRHVERGLAAAGHPAIHPPHLPVFEYIDQDQGSRITDLARHANVSAQAMSEVVAYLERHGYVERVADPADGRARLVRLTDRGRELYARGRRGWSSSSRPPGPRASASASCACSSGCWPTSGTRSGRTTEWARGRAEAPPNPPPPGHPRIQRFSTGRPYPWGVTSRRTLLRSAGVLAAGFALRRPLLDFASPPPAVAAERAPARPRRHGGAPLRGSEVTARGRGVSGRFGLMFKHLAPFAPADALLTELATTMAEPRGGTQPVDNPRIPAGFTFLGQFIDHDLTFDQTPLSDQQVDPDALTNYRTARFDLDSVYGGGPGRSPSLYDPRDRDKLLIAGAGDPTVPDDMPRGPDGIALIPEPRNEENLIVCQIHVAFMKFHNAMVDTLRARACASAPSSWPAS